MPLFTRYLAGWLAGAVLLMPATTAAQPASPAQDSDSDAVEPHRVKGLRVELLGGAGYGRAQLSTKETLNTYGPVGSLRLGYRFGFGGFVGARYDHFFGASSQYLYDSVGNFAFRSRVSSALLELGYELFLPHAFVRPHVGIGGGWVRRSVECKPASGAYADAGQQYCDLATNDERAYQSVRLAVVPGLTMGVRFGAIHLFLEPRYYFRSDANGYALLAGVGMTF